MNEKIEVTTYTLEDNIDYILLDRIDNYLFLANEERPEDLIIRIDEGDYLVGLKDEEEVDKALKLFYEKNKNIKLEA